MKGRDVGMQIDLFGEFSIFTWVILPILIFCARIVDVSIGTLRVIFISRGQRMIAPVMGFFEVIIWLLAIGQIIQNLTNVFCYIAYGGGFAAGTFVGMWIEGKLSLGTSLVRIITARDTGRLEEHLRAMGYGVTIVEAQGKGGETKLLITVVRNNDLKGIMKKIEKYNPRAFYTIEDVRSVGAGTMPLRRGPFSIRNLMLFRPHRKGK